MARANALSPASARDTGAAGHVEALGTAALFGMAAFTQLSIAMRDASICGLGQAAPNPLQSVIKYFPEDVTTPFKAW